MPFTIKVKPSGLLRHDLDTQKFHLPVVVVFSNCFRTQLVRQAGQATSGVWPILLAPDY